MKMQRHLAFATRACVDGFHATALRLTNFEYTGSASNGCARPATLWQFGWPTPSSVQCLTRVTRDATQKECHRRVSLLRGDASRVMSRTSRRYQENYRG